MSRKPGTRSGSKMSKEWHAEYYRTHQDQFKAYRKKFKESDNGKAYAAYLKSPEGQDQTREYCVQRNYKMSRDQHVEALVKQNYLCALRDCGTGVDLKSHIDHDHKCCPSEATCGKCVRGILCLRHNIGLGCFESNPQTLLNAFQYLQGENYVAN